MKIKFSKKSDKDSLYILILILSTLSYISYWSFLTVEKYLSLNASVFDLGLAMQRIWMDYHLITLGNIITSFALQGDSFLFLPLSIYPNYIAMLIFQSVMLGLPAIPIYFIAKDKIRNKIIPLLLSISYLLYFPLSGVNWFDFHFQAFFIMFFLSGFLFYERRHYVLSTVFFFLASATRFPYVAFVLLFWFTELTSISILKRGFVSSGSKKVYLILNIVINASYAIFSYLVLQNGNIILHNSSNLPISAFLTIKAITLFAVFAPVLFLPLFSNRWRLFFLPFAYLVVTSNNPVYLWSWEFRLQYNSAFIPFIFLAIIDVLSIEELKPRLHILKDKTLKKIAFLNIKVKKNAILLTTLITIIMLLSALFFQPYGPFNNVSGDSFEVSSNININQSQLKALDNALSLIPKSNKYVLIQNNLPQALPGPLGDKILVPGLIGPNITLNNIANNNYSWNLAGYHNFTKIDYVLADLNNLNLLNQELGDGPSMFQIIHELLKSGYYGILSEDNGILLLERSYNGSPLFYSSINVSYQTQTIKEIRNISSYFNYKIGNGRDSNFLTPSFYLYPGNYSVTLNFYVSTPTVNNSVYLFEGTNVPIINITSSSLTKINSDNLKYIYYFTISNIIESSKILVSTNEGLSNPLTSIEINQLGT